MAFKSAGVGRGGEAVEPCQRRVQRGLYLISDGQLIKRITDRPTHFLQHNTTFPGRI